MTNDTFHAYAFDGENRIASVDAIGATYTYSPEGERVRKLVGGASTEYLSFAGQIVAEKTSSGWTDYIFANGQRIARATGAMSSTTTYYYADHLGTARLETDSSGVLISNCTYAPFGREVGCSPSDPNNHYKFTGKERDGEEPHINYQTASGRKATVIVTE
jgi:hypothetical protein